MNLAARYGGDEFVAILSDSDLEKAAVFLDRVNQRFAKEFDDADAVTVSAGMAEYQPWMQSPEDLLAAVDAKLYQVKANRPGTRTERPPPDPYSVWNSRAKSAARNGRSLTMMCSSVEWAPPPRGPSPSRVGTPSAAVKQPSLAPPVEPSPRSTPSPAASARAWRYSSTTASVRSNGGRFTPPRTSMETPGVTGRSARMAASTRAASSITASRTSISARASAATTFEAVPPLTTPTLTVVPRAGSASASTARIWCASSAMALAPRSGSTPAWAARPWIRSSYVATPFRAVLAAPPGSDGSGTSTARAPRASDSINAR